MIILKNDILPVLGLDSSYTLKYGPPPLGVPSCEGLYLTTYPSSRLNMDTVFRSVYTTVYSISCSTLYITVNNAADTILCITWQRRLKGSRKSCAIQYILQCAVLQYTLSVQYIEQFSLNNYFTRVIHSLS